MNVLNNQIFLSTQQPIQVQSHAYLSSIRDLQASDNEENLKKKREKQIAFAESLRRQIDEKRQRMQQQRQQEQKYTTNQFTETQQRKETHFTFDEEALKCSQLQNIKPVLSNFGNNEQFNFSFAESFDALSNKPTKNISKYSRKQILSKADLSKFDLFSTSGKLFGNNSTFFNHNPIQINTDSPFATSTVSTPPQGFSMRGPNISQTKNLQTIIAPDSRITSSTFDDSNIINCQNTISLPHDMQPSKYDNKLLIKSKPYNTITKKTNYRPPQIQSRAKSMLLRSVGMKNAVQLNDVSELVYPDGHLSPAVSPRDTTF